MISFHTSLVSFTILILFCSSSFELNSVSAIKTTDISAGIESKDTPLCRQVRGVKRHLVEAFRYYSKDFEDLQCDIQNDCKSLTCNFEDKENISGGYQLLLCDSNPTVEFWVDSPNWEERWAHNFTLKNETQKVEIIQHNKNKNSSSFQKWYLNVSWNLAESNIREQVPDSRPVFVNFSASYEKWSRNSEKLSEIKVINETHFQLSQLCSVDKSSPGNLYSRSPTEDKQKKFIKVNLLQADMADANVKQTISPSSLIGKSCDPSDIFGCGNGATCVVNSSRPTTGICECMQNFILSENGTCISVILPVNPTEAPSTSHSTTGIGIFLAIIALIGIAGAIFFGARRRMFDRIRSRLPDISFWPFHRGTSTVDDQVSMVDPFSNEDDDPQIAL